MAESAAATACPDGVGHIAEAGFYFPYTVALALDVASSGAGVQNTTVVNYTPEAAGFYLVSLSCSTVSADTVSIVATYTDAINTTAQTLSFFSSVPIAANGSNSSSIGIRANTSTSIVVKITLSSQAATKATACVMRVA